MRLSSSRSFLFAAAAAAVVLSGGGCYEVAFFYPSGGQGSPVTDGRTLGISLRLTGEEADGTEGQAYVVLSVGEAYTADATEDPAEAAGLRTIIRIVASVVNETESPARFEARGARLEVAGRVFKPKWTYRSPETQEQTGERAEEEAEEETEEETEQGTEQRTEEEEEAFATVAAGAVARYDVYFDLGEIKLSWKGSWGGEKRSGEVRFVRGSGGYPVAAGPYWGGGWYMWADPWPLGGLIFTTRFGGIGVRSPLFR